METIKQIVWDSFLTLIPAALGVISGFVIWLLNNVIEKLKTQTMKTKDEVAQYRINEALQTIRKVTNDVVISIEQTLVTQIKAAIANGTKDKDDLKALADEAMRRIKDIVGEKLLATLEEAQINADQYISELIEADVYYLKYMNSNKNPVEANKITDGSDAEGGLQDDNC